jgi:hypothetical protein
MYIGTVVDGLTSESLGSRQADDADPNSTTNMEPSYAVAWDTSRDLLQSTTTPTCSHCWIYS